MKTAKYFWGLNEKALKETGRILKNPGHPQFAERMTTLLSRCDEPKEVFSVTPKKIFVQTWPRIRAYWKKVVRESDFRDWWETVYEQILEGSKPKSRRPKVISSALFLRIGKEIREKRIQKGLSQKELAMRIGMKQPDISKIEEGKKNITLGTLAKLCRVLQIKSIALNIP
jgi:DNA-binding Xre family transcriptional regulator